MVRPQISRRVSGSPRVRYFKPQGVPMHSLRENILSEDGLEAIRLADSEGLYHDEAARRMGVSRPTFGRILADARKSVADAITEGNALRIEGGTIELRPAPPQGFGGRGRRRRNWRGR